MANDPKPLKTLTLYHFVEFYFYYEERSKRGRKIVLYK